MKSHPIDIRVLGLAIALTYQFIPILAPISLTARSVQAQTPPQVPTVPSTVINGLLVNNASREFFEAGQAQLEAEIRTLRRRELAQTEPLLTIREESRQLPEDSFLEGEGKGKG